MTATRVADPVAPPRTETSRRSRLRRIDVWYPAGLAIVVLVLSAFSLSGSSTAIWSRSGAHDDSLVAGAPRAIRTDEYQITSPLKTGRVESEFSDTISLGLGTQHVSDVWRPQIVSRALPAAIYAPFNLPLAWLPLEQGFALYWWLPFLACALGTYAWLRAMRVQEIVALCASLLVTLAPAAVWWSGWVAQSMAISVIPCAIFVAGVRLFPRRPLGGFAVGVGAGIAAAGLPWFYPPWTLPAALFAGAVTVAWGLTVPGRRKPFLLVGLAAGAVFALESGLFYLHERDYYQALSDTVYPGARRETGGGVAIGKLFSSLFPFVFLDPAREISNDNTPELAMGWTIALPLAFGAAVLGRRAVWRDRERWLLVGALASALILASWCLVEWPGVLAKLSLLTFAQPTRVAPMLGFFGVVLLALLLGEKDRRERLLRDIGRSGAVILGVGTAFLVFWSATEFRATYVNDISTIEVVGALLVVGLVGATLFTRWWLIALGVATTVAVVSGLWVNPLMHGTGALHHSAAARTIKSIDDRVVQPADGRWAADSFGAIALINGNGASSLTSFNDPVDTKAWTVLDPQHSSEYAWNRFGYIVFVWEPGLGSARIDLPFADEVTVTVDPCDPKLTTLRLAAIVSTKPLESVCLNEVTHFKWQGQDQHVYRRSGVGQ